jgi:galactitol-specific phosphotransferase system IIC component
MGPSHFLIMCVFSILVGAFFATLTRDSLREAIKAGTLLTVTMVGISLIIAYVMYFLPLGG